MVELSIKEILLIIAGGLIGHLAYGNYIRNRVIKNLKRKNARLADEVTSQDRALIKVAGINRKLITGIERFAQNKPISIIATKVEIVKEGSKWLTR